MLEGLEELIMGRVSCCTGIDTASFYLYGLLSPFSLNRSSSPVYYICAHMKASASSRDDESEGLTCKKSMPN